ncbi:hypothetical protein PG994_008493 [Apiospora phragmitis]|uniref:Uncharacterized protein n=1 Tax=Apiospora phragmitis TaxID=2905665 RepID=A0ABR1UGK7_9PEZI
MFGLGSATPEASILMPAATGRNLGAGMFVWIMVLLGEHKSLGAFFLCWTWTGIADFKVLYGHPKAEKRMLGVNVCYTAALGVLGAFLIGYAP